MSLSATSSSAHPPGLPSAGGGKSAPSASQTRSGGAPCRQRRPRRAEATTAFCHRHVTLTNTARQWPRRGPSARGMVGAAKRVRGVRGSGGPGSGGPGVRGSGGLGVRGLVLTRARNDLRPSRPLTPTLTRPSKTHRRPWPTHYWSTGRGAGGPSPRQANLATAIPVALGWPRRPGDRQRTVLVASACRRQRCSTCRTRRPLRTHSGRLSNGHYAGAHRVGPRADGPAVLSGP